MVGPHNRYRYVAFGRNGIRESGVIEADDRADAVRRLSRAGRVACELTAFDKPAVTMVRLPGALYQQRINLARFFDDLAVMLNAGFTIDVALRAVAGSESRTAQRAKIDEVLARICEGRTVAGAFATLPEISPEIVALLEAGQSSGRLEVIFSELAADHALRDKRKREITEALLYPAFLIVVMLVTLLLLAVYLVPAIEPIFDNAGVEPPLMIAVMSAIGGFLSGHAAAILSLTALTALLVIRRLRAPQNSARLHRILVALPVVGGQLRSASCNRYLRLMALLVANGIPLHSAMQLAARSVPAHAFRQKLVEARDNASAGEPLWQTLQRTGLFDGSSISLVRLGEESNNLAATMGRAATMLEMRLHRSVSRSLTFLTPTITVVLGLLVGTLVMSVMSALLSMNEIAIR